MRVGRGEIRRSSLTLGRGGDGEGESRDETPESPRPTTPTTPPPVPLMHELRVLPVAGPDNDGGGGVPRFLSLGLSGSLFFRMWISGGKLKCLFL